MQLDVTDQESSLTHCQLHSWHCAVLRRRDQVNKKGNPPLSLHLFTHTG